jgi:hypothetical protein
MKEFKKAEEILLEGPDGSKSRLWLKPDGKIQLPTNVWPDEVLELARAKLDQLSSDDRAYWPLREWCQQYTTSEERLPYAGPPLPEGYGPYGGKYPEYLKKIYDFDRCRSCAKGQLPVWICRACKHACCEHRCLNYEFGGAYGFCYRHASSTRFKDRKEHRNRELWREQKGTVKPVV